MALMAIYGERVATGFEGSVSTWRVPIVVEELLMLAMRGVETGERMHQHGGRVIVAFAIIGAMFTGVSAAAQQTLSWPERNLTSFASCDYDGGRNDTPNEQRQYEWYRCHLQCVDPERPERLNHTDQKMESACIKCRGRNA
jgi:hypothetical protein